MLPRLSILLGVAILAFGLIAPTLAADGDTLEVRFIEQSDSGLTGTATLTEQGGQTTVSMTFAGAPDSVEQPAHIHAGSCAVLDPAPAYPLNNVVGGKSETTVDVSLAELLAAPFAINVHKSAEEISTYVACADLVASTSGQVMPNTGAATDDGGTSPLVPVAGAGLILLGIGIALQRRRIT